VAAIIEIITKRYQHTEKFSATIWTVKIKPFVIAITYNGRIPLRT
jgi:hypothetical protein